ncbi:MAG: hypothetical protein HUJ25_12920 [Crocinitomicaceae bacterium]|nr:hypothetical protein [Crocinitomicaceae bacterium]
MKNITQILLILVLTISTSCRKSAIPTNVEPDPEPELTLQDKLVGTYLGFRDKMVEDITCPNCNPPCSFDYTYYTDPIEIQIVKHSADSIEVIDLLDGTSSRIIEIDSTLTYYGDPPFNAPYGHYSLEFSGLNNDSLILDLEYGGGTSCYASFYYADYVLVKQ